MTRQHVAFGICLAAASVAAAIAQDAIAPAAAGSQLSLLKTLPLGGEGRWDYLCVDSAAHRLYVPRSSHVQVVDPDKGTVIGDIPETTGVHGVALAPEQKLGFTSNGRSNSATAFDLETFKAKATINTGKNPDAILYDPASKHIMTFNHSGGDVTVIDPAALDKAPVTISVPGTLEYAAADGAGHVFVAVEDKSEIAEIDSSTNTVLAHWPLAPGESPTGLAIDVEHHRLFAGCGNKMMVIVDSQSGKVIGTPAVGNGVDGVAYDPTLGVAVSANGRDGTASVVKETSPGKFETVQTVKTVNGARTIAADPATHRFYAPCNVPDGKGGQTFGIAVVGVAETK